MRHNLDRVLTDISGSWPLLGLPVSLNSDDNADVYSDDEGVVIEMELEEPQYHDVDENVDARFGSSRWQRCQAQMGFKALSCIIGGGITFLFSIILFADLTEFVDSRTADYSGTFVVIVAPYLSCNLSRGAVSLGLWEGVSVPFPSLHLSQIDDSCWQVGSLAQAVIGMGLNGTMLFLDAGLRETLPRALLAASALHQRAAVVVWNHALAQSLVDRTWVRLLHAAQPANVRWASIGNNIRDDRFARDTHCPRNSVCGCTDPHTGYIDCLAGVFNLSVLMLQSKVDLLRDTIHRGQLSGIDRLPAASFASSVASEALWASLNSRWRNVSQISQMRMMVDCGDREENPDAEALEQARLDMLFAGVERYHAANPFGLKVNATTFSCQDIRVNVLHRGRLDPAQFLETLISFDVYAPVLSDPVGYASAVPQAQMAGIPVLSTGNTLGLEFVEEGVTGFVPTNPDGVQQSLVSIARDLASNTLRERIHAAAAKRFSPPTALKQIILGLFPEVMGAR